MKEENRITKFTRSIVEAFLVVFIGVPGYLIISVIRGFKLGLEAFNEITKDWFKAEKVDE